MLCFLSIVEVEQEKSKGPQKVSSEILLKRVIFSYSFILPSLTEESEESVLHIHSVKTTHSLPTESSFFWKY